jgi:hypothetical protein
MQVNHARVSYNNLFTHFMMIAMQRYYGFFLSLMLLLSGLSAAYAQASIRPEDHFFRRRVVNRIDLNEKINYPLIRRSGSVYGNARQGGEGLVASLLRGLEAGQYQAFQPDDIHRPMSYQEVMARMQDFDLAIVGDVWESEVRLDDERWEEVDSTGSVVAIPANTPGLDEMDLGPYEQAIQFVEDRVFDKNRGEMAYHIDYFQLIWSDPGEMLPEKVLAVFRYKDVAERLDRVFCYNSRFNDAESRTMKEVFELRRFNSYIIQVSGHGVQSLPESELRRQQLTSYEHELWNY